MHIQEQNKQSISVVVSEQEAAHILEGLERFHDQLEEGTQALEQALKDAGVTPPPDPDHVRYEYAPPMD